VVGGLAGVAGGVSVASSGVALALGGRYVPGSGAATGWVVVEAVALLVLVALVVRVVPARPAVLAGGLAGVAVPAWLLRFGPPELSGPVLGGFGAWAGAAVLAAGVGGYLRSLDARRSRAVRDARRAQRLSLARDLHDFVAHDVTEILAQAQAAQLLADQDPPTATTALHTIEEAALRALTAMDRTIHLLHDDPDPTPSGSTLDATADSPPAAPAVPVPALAELPELTGRFAAAGAVAVDLEVEAAVAGLSREVAATAYRVVLEALTNVRRHAPGARRVAVTLRRTGAGSGAAVEVTVTDDGGGQGRGTGSVLRSVTRVGGLGLAGLAERVEALGGHLTAGPHRPDRTNAPGQAAGPGRPEEVGGIEGVGSTDAVGGAEGWRVVAVLPVGGGTR
jgi:signal transduction histidine kinase